VPGRLGQSAFSLDRFRIGSLPGAPTSRIPAVLATEGPTARGYLLDQDLTQIKPRISIADSAFPRKHKLAVLRGLGSRSHVFVSDDKGVETRSNPLFAGYRDPSGDLEMINAIAHFWPYRAAFGSV
jgi:hypothetical protein